LGSWAYSLKQQELCFIVEETIKKAFHPLEIVEMK